MKGYIFDLDGTMVDNMVVHHKAWQKLLSEQGKDFTMEEVRRNIHGINEEIIKRIFGNKYSSEEIKRIGAEKEAQYRELFKPELKLIPGLDNFLKLSWDKGISLGVATAAPVENLDFVLDNLNLRMIFKAALHAGDVRRGKPDPEVYLKTAKLMELQPKECLVFEDSPTGAMSAINAGMKVIVITTTHDSHEFSDMPVTGFIENYSDLEPDSFNNIS